VTLSGKLAGQASPTTSCSSLPAPRKDRACRSPRLRATVADLPLRFALDDSMALAGGRKISDFASVSVEARIAKAG
jgi:hypothetical protein